MDFKDMKLSDLTKEQLIDIIKVQKRNLDLQENFLINIYTVAIDTIIK